MNISDLPLREQRGSRARCILLTEGPVVEVASRLTAIGSPFAVIDPHKHRWMPNGLSGTAEAKLGNAEGLLSEDQREIVTRWWLALSDRANTPNWDIASTALIEGREGVLLVEAKAHGAELKHAGHGIKNEKNLVQIRSAVEEANAALRKLDSRWCLSCDSHYQLANRFAWSWKLASLGIPVVLAYVGFLNASEMAYQGRPFPTLQSWESAVRSHAEGVVPHDVWEEEIDVTGTPLRAIIRALEFPLPNTANPSKPDRT